MIELAASSSKPPGNGALTAREARPAAELRAAPLFLILTEPMTRDADREAARRLADETIAACAPALGFEPDIRTAQFQCEGPPSDAASRISMYDHDPGTPAAERDVFVLPALAEFHLLHKQTLSEWAREWRREHDGARVMHDDSDPAHPLLVQAYLDRALEALRGNPISGQATGTPSEPLDPRRMGLLLVAAGEFDPAERARAYQLMRLVWEGLGFARSEVAFLRHEKTPLPEQLERCARDPIRWLILPRMFHAREPLEYIRLILGDFARRRPEAAAWPIAQPLGQHPNLIGWLRHRVLALWNDYRRSDITRAPSVRRGVSPLQNEIFVDGRPTPLQRLKDFSLNETQRRTGVIARVRNADGLSQLFNAFDINGGVTFVKVTWHGYAPGTYTDPVALDMLLSALDGKVILLESHTASRNLGGAAWDWNGDCREQRAWIRQQEEEYLARTGLREVIDRHGAQYLNLTEAWWDGQCAPAAEVEAILAERGCRLESPELAGFIPSVLLNHRGARFLSFARFKGPTRLSISNCFGLIPIPFRAAWHGPDITHFARVCCDLARIYDCLFESFGIVESLNHAVRWARDGLYRSRWGNYDLIHAPGLVTLSRGLAGADVLAARLQGQRIERSAFFDIVSRKLGIPGESLALPIEESLIRSLA